MTRAVGFWLAAAAAGVVLGLGSAWVAVSQLSLAGRVVAGGWSTNLNTGSSEADPYTRAAVARDGLLALARSETVYFTRDKDDAGAPLGAACRYRLLGRDMPARWWSVTLYDETQYLARNEDGAHSIDATGVTRAGDGFEATIGGARDGAANWLSTRNAGHFSLTLRLYNPDPAIQADPGKVAAPRVQKIDCAEGA
jgi:hypothetical protein